MATIPLFRRSKAGTFPPTHLDGLWRTPLVLKGSLHFPSVIGKEGKEPKRSDATAGDERSVGLASQIDIRTELMWGGDKDT